MQYRYRPRYRPPGFVTLPTGLVWEFAEMPPDLAHRRPEVPRSSHRFGVIATARALTDEELERFELDVHQSAFAGDEPSLADPESRDEESGHPLQRRWTTDRARAASRDR